MTVPEDRPSPEIGSPRRRKEDARLIGGRTRWTDNMSLPGMLHLAMVADANLPSHNAESTGPDDKRGGAA